MCWFGQQEQEQWRNIANNGDHEDHGNNNSEDDRNGDIGYHINDGNNDDMDDGNSHNDGQNDAGPSRSAFEVVYSADKNDGGNKTEEVDPGLSCLRGHCSTQSWSQMKWYEEYIYIILWVKPADSILRCQHHAVDTNILFQQ